MDNKEVTAIEFAKFKKDLIEIIEKTELDEGVNLVLLFEEERYCESCNERHKMMHALAHSSDKFLMGASQSLLRKVLMRSFGIDDGNEWGNHKEN